MSSYLNFFLVPKKKEGATIEPKPLLFISYSRNSGIYKSFEDSIHPVFSGDSEENYTELTKEDMERTIKYAKEDLNIASTRLENKVKAYRELTDSVPEEAIQDYISTKEYIKRLETNVNDLENIYTWVYDLEYSDFEKVLINID